jgi:DNA-binding CsgD family transcriptional regulator
VEAEPPSDLEARALTGREIEVLRLIAAGLSAKETAKILAIAPRTVERHIDHIRLKTRTRNRSHMIAFAIESGYLED